MAIAGIDIGSTGAKITVFDRDGKQLHYGYREYPKPRGIGAQEIDANSIWQAAKELLQDAARAVPQMSAVGITSFGESFVLLDERQEPLMPIMMYTDPRGAEEAKALERLLGRERIADLSGAAPHPMYTLPKLMWVKTHRPQVYAQAKYCCLIADFLVFKLTGERIIDYSLAARTMGLNVQTLRWSDPLFQAAGLGVKLFSRPVPPGTCAGQILPDVAQRLALPPDLRIVLCCHDQVAAAVGSGVMRPGRATDGAGTVECITPVFDHLPADDRFQENAYAVIPFVHPGTYCCYAFQFTGGSLTKWFTDTLAGDDRIRARANNVSLYDQLESGMTDAPTGILALPHFAGAGTPYMDADAKGALVGLTLNHTASDLYRALMEGICYEMRLNVEALAQSGIYIEALNASGGCAKSRLWLQMKADILGLPIHRMNVDEAGTVGGIMLTGVATGVYRDLDEAADALVGSVEVFEPRAEQTRAYGSHYARYKQLYAAIRPLME